MKSPNRVRRKATPDRPKPQARKRLVPLLRWDTIPAVGHPKNINLHGCVEILADLPNQACADALQRLCDNTLRGRSRLAGAIIAAGVKAFLKRPPKDLVWRPDPSTRQFRVCLGYPNGQGATAVTWPVEKFSRISQAARPMGLTINQFVTLAVDEKLAAAGKKGGAQ